MCSVRANVVFSAYIAVGDYDSLAVWGLEESGAGGYESLDGLPTVCVETELENLGAQDWYDCLPKKATEQGVYFLTGSASFEEDDVEYLTADYQSIKVC